MSLIVILIRVILWIGLYCLYRSNMIINYNSLQVSGRLVSILVVVIVVFSITPLYKLANRDASKKKELKKHEPQYKEVTVDDITMNDVREYTKKNKIKL